MVLMLPASYQVLCFILHDNWDRAFEKLRVRAELFIVMSSIPECKGKAQDEVSWYATDEEDAFSQPGLTKM